MFGIVNPFKVKRKVGSLTLFERKKLCDKYFKGYCRDCPLKAQSGAITICMANRECDYNNEIEVSKNDIE